MSSPKPRKKETHEDGTGHNCDVKGCPMCWNDGYNQGREDMDKWWVERIRGADIEDIIGHIPHGFTCDKVANDVRSLLLGGDE